MKNSTRLEPPERILKKALNNEKSVVEENNTVAPAPTTGQQKTEVTETKVTESEKGDKIPSLAFRMNKQPNLFHVCGYGGNGVPGISNTPGGTYLGDDLYANRNQNRGQGSTTGNYDDDEDNTILEFSFSLSNMREMFTLSFDALYHQRWDDFFIQGWINTNQNDYAKEWNFSGGLGYEITDNFELSLFADGTYIDRFGFHWQAGITARVLFSKRFSLTISYRQPYSKKKIIGSPSIQETHWEDNAGWYTEYTTTTNYAMAVPNLAIDGKIIVVGDFFSLIFEAMIADAKYNLGDAVVVDSDLGRYMYKLGLGPEFRFISPFDEEDTIILKGEGALIKGEQAIGNWFGGNYGLVMATLQYSFDSKGDKKFSDLTKYNKVPIRKVVVIERGEIVKREEKEDKVNLIIIYHTGGIKGSRGPGKYVYKKSDNTNVNCSYSLLPGWENLIAKVDGVNTNPSSIKVVMNKDHLIELWAEEEEKEYTLTTIINEGADGNPKQGVTTHPEGTEIPYKYWLLAGYRGLDVEVDGADTNKSGQVVMNQDHKIEVWATPIKDYVLTIILHDGTGCNPTHGKYIHQEGTKVNYSSWLLAGYKDLILKVDNVGASDSGQVVMNQDHLIEVWATPIKDYMLTVILHDGTGCNPTHGKYIHQEGTKVNYSCWLLPGHKDLLVELDGSNTSTSGQVTMNQDHLIEVWATPIKNYKLTTILHDGTTGIPVQGVTTHPEGTVINYAYSPLTGYKDLDVKVDTVAASATGQVVMNQDHLIEVWATKECDPPEGKLKREGDCYTAIISLINAKNVEKAVLTSHGNHDLLGGPLTDTINGASETYSGYIENKCGDQEPITITAYAPVKGGTYGKVTKTNGTTTITDYFSITDTGDVNCRYYVKTELKVVSKCSNDQGPFKKEIERGNLNPSYKTNTLVITKGDKVYFYVKNLLGSGWKAKSEIFINGQQKAQVTYSNGQGGIIDATF